MTQVALPEMRRAGYDAGLSAGVVAAGGTLAIMIPPSVMFVLYSILTETDLASLFIAGIIPGLIAIVLYCADDSDHLPGEAGVAAARAACRLERAVGQPQGCVGDARCCSSS